MADGYVPVYINEIINEWQEMPSEFDNFWHEYGFSNDTTIPDLMKIDLYGYYREQTEKAYNEVKNEKDEDEE